MITQLELFQILNYNPYNGIFLWIGSKRFGYNGKIAGSENNYGYIQIEINGKTYAAHRLAWLYITGNHPKHEIDHIDLNKSNNKWENLREANRSENCGNQLVRKNNKSGIKGVSWYKRSNKWLAQIQINNNKVFLGHYTNIEDVAKAYENAAKFYFAEYARTE